MARHHRHVAPYDHLHVERLPPAALLVLGVVLPEPAPVLEPHVGVAIHVEEDAGGIVAPDRLQGRPVEGGVGAKVGVVGGEDGLVVGVGAAVEVDRAWHAGRLTLPAPPWDAHVHQRAQLRASIRPLASATSRLYSSANAPRRPARAWCCATRSARPAST